MDAGKPGSESFVPEFVLRHGEAEAACATPDHLSPWELRADAVVVTTRPEPPAGGSGAAGDDEGSGGAADASFDDPEELRFDTDGRPYSHLQFLRYYGDHAAEQWRGAAKRVAAY